METIFRSQYRSPQPIITAGNAAAEQSPGASCEYGISIAGNRDRGGKGDLVDSVSPSGWGDIHRGQHYGKRSGTQHSAHEEANTGVFGVQSHATMEATVGSSAPLITSGASGSGDGDNNSKNMRLGVVKSKPGNTSPQQDWEGEIEDRVMTTMGRQQESLADGSFSHVNSNCIESSIDISPEDWLQVAKETFASDSS